MRKLRFALLAPLALAFVLPATASDRKSYPMNVPAAGAESVVFDVQEGDFVLRGDPVATEIRMNVSIDRAWIFKLGEEGILHKLITVSGQGTKELKITTDIPRAISNWGRAQYPIDFEVVIPAGMKVRLHDTSGKVELVAVRGDVETDDGSGTLAVWQLGGALRLRKQSGDIRVEEVRGPTVINSHSGQIHLARLNALEVEASDGNLDVSDVASARIHNRGGNISVQRVKGDVEIDDDSGEIVVADVAGAVHIRDTSGQIRTARTGAVTIQDTSGDVTVVQAASLHINAKESGEVMVRSVEGQVEAAPGVKVKPLP
ncbi:MAG: DUF4097 domain-containing protein [Acidobacteriota bacterium]|nr:DUF4097 domain-containing protein [Acidobacteriota bacterium]